VSTHDLSRTVIEGGRYFHNTDERRQSHKSARRKARAEAHRLVHDSDRADAVGFEPTPVVRVAQRDCLSAAERWLASHAGRPWRKVEGLIRATFDTRTIAGQHVVFDHLLPRGDWRVGRSWRPPGWFVHRWRFFVDRHGLLRVDTRRRRWPGAPEPVRPHGTPDVKRWLSGRRVRAHDGAPYWLEPTGTVRSDGVLGYRQGRPLDAWDARVWRRLSDAERAYAAKLLSTHATKLDELVRVGGVEIAAGVAA
jgi:hypothetical protein